MRAFIFMGRPPPEDGEDLYGYCRLTYKKSSKYTPTAAETAEANRKEDAKAAAKDAKEVDSSTESYGAGCADWCAVIESTYPGTACERTLCVTCDFCKGRFRDEL